MTETHITITTQDDTYIIRDEKTGVTTQADTKIESLLMLADALSGHPSEHDTHSNSSPPDPLSLSLDVFVQDFAMKKLHEELFHTDSSYTDLSDEKERSQKQAAVYLARHHKTIDFSNPDNLNILLELLNA